MIEASLDHLPLGPVPRRNDALGEFHCIRPDPRYAAWREPTNHWTWKSPNWQVAEDAQGRFLEQGRHSRSNNTLILSHAFGPKVRAAEVDLWCAEVRQEVGLVVAYHTALDYLCLHFDPGGVKLSRREHEQFTVLAELPGQALAPGWHRLGVTRARGRLVGLVDGEEALAAPWRGPIDGEVGLLANCPARFRRLRAEARPRRRRRKRRRPAYPAMKAARKLDTRGFGTARQIRFGDLTGDGSPDILLAQRSLIDGMPGYSTISCLTAMTTEGEVLWQSGQPAPQEPMAGDLPFQVGDIDGDGRNEVVCVRDFEIQVLDGATGQLQRAAPVPPRPEHHPLLRSVVSYFGARDGREFPRVVANALRFADLGGRGAARDLLLKDAYHHLWAFSPKLEVLWSFCGNLGHFPFCADTDADGRDEVVAGYHWLSPDGRELQSLHLGDHADAVYAGDLQGWGEPKAVRAGGDDGFLVGGLGGDLLAVRLGHAQRLSIANFRPHAPGLEYALCTYWGAPGIVALLDHTAKLLWAREYPLRGNTLQPVNWTADGLELLHFSAHARHGGLYDWRGQQVVPYPSDGHPELCSEALDLLGCGRDNLVAWDPDRLWIYAPADDREPRYRPRRPPLHSTSNYMAYWSLPPSHQPAARD